MHEIYDNFDRADTAPGVVGKAVTGQPWIIDPASTGIGSVQIVGKELLTGAPGTNQTFYMKCNMGKQIREMGVRCVWDAGANPQLVSCLSSRQNENGNANLIWDNIHFFANPTVVSVGYFKNGVLITIASPTIALLADGVTEHLLGWRINDNDEIQIFWPGGSQKYSVPGIHWIIGKTAVFEIGDTLTTVNRCRMREVMANTVDAQSTGSIFE